MDFYKGIPKPGVAVIDQLEFGVLDVCNPYNSSVIQTLRKQDCREVERVIGYAASYDHSLTAWQRYEMRRNFAGLLQASTEESTWLISRKSDETLKRCQNGSCQSAPDYRAEHLPFGGIKDSGIGREGIKYAVDSMSQSKTIVM